MGYYISAGETLQGAGDKTSFSAVDKKQLDMSLAEENNVQLLHEGT